MSAILNRLVSRAMGGDVSNLRARVPARFEEAAAFATDGFTTIEEEVTAQRPSPREPAPGRRPDRPRDDAFQAPPPPGETPRPRRQAGIRERSPGSVDQENVETAAGIGREDRQRGGVDRKQSVPPEAEAHMMHAAHQVTPAAPEEVVEWEPAGGTIDDVADSLHDRSSSPPSPLLAVPPDGPPQSPWQYISQAMQNAGSTGAPDDEVLPAADTPEITIEIGRIDVRTEAEKPGKPERVARRPSPVSSLTDYLKGRGS